MQLCAKTMKTKAKLIAQASFVAFLLVIGVFGNVSAAIFNPDQFRTDAREIVLDDSDFAPISPYERGDVTRDGVIDEYDLFFLIRYIFKGGDAPDPIQLADFNEDSKINIGDVVALTRYMIDEGIINPEYANFEKGDVNTDGSINLDDVYFLIDYMFKGGEKPNFLFLADFNNDFQINIGDVVSLINYLKENGLVDDTQAPTISLINPDDEDVYRTSSSKRNINFDFIVSDENNIDYCELIINDGVTETIDNPLKNTELRITVELSKNNDYEWKVKCVDILGNSGESETRDFQIRDKKSSSNDENNAYSGVIYTNTGSEDDDYQFNFEDTNPITINTQENNKETQITFFVEYLVPIFLGLCIILLIIMLAIVMSRRNEVVYNRY